jgi:hypothetical protein
MSFEERSDNLDFKILLTTVRIFSMKKSGEKCDMLMLELLSILDPDHNKFDF